MSEATVLTPQARPKPPFPRLPLVVLLLGVPVTVFLRDPLTSLVAENPYITLHPAVLGTLPLSLALCALAGWLEGRIYLRLWPERPRRRLALTLLVPLLGFVALALMMEGLFYGARHFPLLGLFVPMLVIGGYWFAASAAGTAITVSVDVVVSAMAQRFRTRVLLAVMALLAIASVGSACLAIWCNSLVGDLISRPASNATPAGLALIAKMRAHPLRVDAVIFSLVSLLFVPIAVSAVGKLAEGVMERLHPLALAFDALTQGRRDVRVEEAGSIEFTQLGSRFNRMMDSLVLAEQMEHAFGMYVSGQLMKRIRSQHGAALLPPSVREATVLFADIRGFTQMSERIQPEAIVGLLNRYFDRVVQVVNEHEGYLNKFIGDAVVVVFNGPVDQADHPTRAVKCAIALQQAVDELNRDGAFPELSEPLGVGIGIATGPMVCGNIGGKGHVEYTAIGDAVNLAARLTGNARPGEVWTNSVAAVQLPAELPAEPLEPIRVKGKAEPVLPFRVWPRRSEASGRAMTPASA